MEQAFQGYQTDYQIKSKINWTRESDDRLLAELHTKRSDGVDLCVYTRPGEVTVGAIAELGESREISVVRGAACVRIRFTSEKQVQSAGLDEFLKGVTSRLAD